ncbi:hypothetical protein BJX64DRAFT_81168 [Aspergillus heterothallicus]
MAKGFEKVNACSVGNFEENTSRIPKWIVNNGGTYSKQVTEDTTHLISTEEAFSKNVTAVEKAKELETVWIVSYDWLSDSLLLNNRKPLPAAKYLLGNSITKKTPAQKKGRQTKTKDNKIPKSTARKGKAVQQKAVGSDVVQDRTQKIKTENTKTEHEGIEKRKIQQENDEKEQAVKAGQDKTENQEIETDMFEQLKADCHNAEKQNISQERSQQVNDGQANFEKEKVEKKEAEEDAALKTLTTEEKPKPLKRKRKRGPAKSRDPFDTKRRTPKAQSVALNYVIYEADDITYSAMLVRPSDSIRGTREILRVKIYQSIDSPHTYATHISWSRLGPSKTDFLAPLGSSLETAMAKYKGFFKDQTGTEWNDRLTAVAPPPKKDEHGHTLPPHRGWFWWDSGTVSLASMFRDGKL